MVRRAEAAKAAGLVSVAVLASRILGLVREGALAAVFGAGFYMDAWLVASRIPNMLRDLFAEGALSSAFLPTFTAALKKEGPRHAWQLANLVINTLLLILGLLALVFFLFSDIFVYLIAGGFSEVPGKVEVTSHLLKVLSPFILLVALASVAMGMLNAFDRFFLPALAPAVFNVCVILAVLGLAPVFMDWGLLGIYAVAVGALVGGLLQFMVQWPLLRRHGFRYRPRLDFQHEGIRRIGRLIAPAIVGVSAVQLNILINTQLASTLGDGPVSWLSYAFRLIYLPIGLFGVAVGVVNLKEVSVHAAAESWEQLKETVANSIKLILLLAIPSTVGLVVLATPVIRAIYQRGEFDAADTHNTALALIFYTIGLVSYSCIKVYVPTFYALDDTRTPVRISLQAVMVNLTINLTLVFLILPESVAHAGLAFGTSAGAVFSHWKLASALRRKKGSLRRYGIGPAFWRCAAASLVMAAVALATHDLAASLWSSPEGELARWLTLVLAILGGAGVYFLVCWLLGVEEVRLLIGRLRKN